MSKNRKNAASESEINFIIENKENGMSSRKICRKLGWNESRKSSVNNIYNRYKEGKLEKTDTLQEWEIEKQQLDVLCESKDFNVSNLAKRLRTAQRNNGQLRKIQREVFDSEGDTEYDFASVMKDVVKDLIKVKPVTLPLPNSKKSKRTIEILFSDLQIGKITEHYNTDVAISCLEYYGKEVLKKVQQVNPERIVFAALGDNCECALKHGIQSAISTDTSNAQQLTNCIREVWKHVLLPLFSLGIPVDFHGV